MKQTSIVDFIDFQLIRNLKVVFLELKKKAITIFDKSCNVLHILYFLLYTYQKSKLPIRAFVGACLRRQQRRQN